MKYVAGAGMFLSCMVLFIALVAMLLGLQPVRDCMAVILLCLFSGYLCSLLIEDLENEQL